MADDDPYRLATRKGLPDDLRFLLQTYPREGWQAHANIGGMAGFWLQRHDMFRTLGAMMTKGIGEYREGRFDPAGFARWLVPRFNLFLGELNGHHNIEDIHYFPAFARAEPRLERGLEILDRDHHVIQEALVANAETANALLQCLDKDRDGAQRAADAYSGANDALLAMLMRHLHDEEDLIIPLILDRGDGGLG